MANLTRKTFLLTETQIEKLNYLKKKIGVNSDKVVFDMAFDLFYSKKTAYGEDPITGTGTALVDDIDKVAKRKVAMKAAEIKAQADLKLAPKIKICTEDLQGEVRDGLCFYKQYFLDGSVSDENCPIAFVGQHTIDNQFIPNKEVIMKNYPKLFKK